MNPDYASRGDLSNDDSRLLSQQPGRPFHADEAHPFLYGGARFVGETMRETDPLLLVAVLLLSGCRGSVPEAPADADAKLKHGEY